MTSWRPIQKIVNYAGSGNWRPGAQTVQGSVDQIRVKSWKTAKVRVAPPGCQIVDPPEQGLLPKTSSSGDLQTLKLTNGNIEVEVMSIFVCSNHELEQCSRSDTAITSNINIAKGLSAFTKFTLKISKYWSKYSFEPWNRFQLLLKVLDQTSSSEYGPNFSFLVSAKLTNLALVRLSTFYHWRVISQSHNIQLNFV